MSRLIVAGMRRDGSNTAHTYPADTDVSALVMSRYRQGFRSLRVWRESDPDRTAIAMITRDEHGARCYWFAGDPS